MTTNHNHTHHTARESGGDPVTPPTPGTWVAPPPSQLPDLRIRLCERLLDRLHIAEFEVRFACGISPLIPRILAPSGMTAEMKAEVKAALNSMAGSVTAHSERRRLNQAHLYWMDQDVTALAAAATPSQEPVRAHRMPAAAGLMVFAHPIGRYDFALAASVNGAWTTAAPGLSGQGTYPVVAVSWSRWTPAELEQPRAPGIIRWKRRTSTRLRTSPSTHSAPLKPEFEGVWLTFWTTASKGWEALPPAQPIAIENSTDKAITAGDMVTAGRTVGSTHLQTFSELLLPFDHPLPPPTSDNANHDTGHHASPNTGQWVHVVHTAWQLMAQTGNAQLTEIETVPRPRLGLKRDKRARIAGPGAVQLVRMRSKPRRERVDHEQ
jgi:hypothetical protein